LGCGDVLFWVFNVLRDLGGVFWVCLDFDVWCFIVLLDCCQNYGRSFFVLLSLKILIMMKSFIFLLFFVFVWNAQAQQLVSTDPVFPYENEAVSIIFDATQGSGGLANYTGDVYAHTGVITNLSTSGGDWKYVKTNWGQNTAATKLTALGNHLYRLDITPSVRGYYGVAASETILQMVFVFRSASQVGGQWLEGKTAAGGDIFVDVFQPSLNVQITSPSVSPLIVEPNGSVTISAVSSLADNLSVYLNGVLLGSGSGESFSEVFSATDFGGYTVVAAAQSGGTTVYDTAYFFVRPPVLFEDLPANVHHGVNYLDDSRVVLALYAPSHDYAFALGDYSDWQPTLENYMRKSLDNNWFWCEIDGLLPGVEYSYQYLVDGDLRVADPYGEKVLDPWNDSYIGEDVYPDLLPYPVGKTTGIVSVLQTAQTPYVWQNGDFEAPSKTDLVIYELLVRDFSSGHSYRAVIDTLDYLVGLGVNAIELMPVNEFEGNSSWGYNVSFMFAPDKYYGTKADLKALVDAAHERGMAVFVDMVLNHQFGQSPLVQLWWDGTQPSGNSPYFNAVAKHDFNVGYDMNHESLATKGFVLDVVRHWLDEYRVDGFRFDLSKGFTQNNTLGNTFAWGQYDASRVNIWKGYGDSIWASHPDAYLILEHLADNVEEKVLSDYGFMLWGNMNYNFNQNTMGYSDGCDIGWASYQARNWNDPHLVGYMESHDEERLMYKNLQYGRTNVATGYDVKDLSTAIRRMEPAAVMLMSIPGPKMIWQFGELGYDYSIDFNGRVGEKPVRWDYYYNVDRFHLYQVFGYLNRLKVERAAFETESYSLNVNGLLKRVNLNGSDMNVTVVASFDVGAGSVNPNFQHTGVWYDYFSGESLVVNNATAAVALEAGEYHIYTDVLLPTPNVVVGMESLDPQNSYGGVWSVAYPNPASDGIAIEYEVLPGVAHVGVRVQDVFGRTVAVLFEGEQGHGGYKVVWEVGDAPAGLYFYVVDVDGRRSVRSFVVK
jgi:hypothetical protein